MIHCYQSKEFPAVGVKPIAGIFCFSVKEDLPQEIVVAKFPQVVPVVVSFHKIILVRNPFLTHDISIIAGGFYAPGILSSNREIDIARHRLRRFDREVFEDRRIPEGSPGKGVGITPEQGAKLPTYAILDCHL